MNDWSKKPVFVGHEMSPCVIDGDILPQFMPVVKLPGLNLGPSYRHGLVDRDATTPTGDDLPECPSLEKIQGMPYPFRFFLPHPKRIQRRVLQNPFVEPIVLVGIELAIPEQLAKFNWLAGTTLVSETNFTL